MDFTVYGDAALLDEAETLIGSLEEQVSVTDEHSDIYAIDHTGSGSLSGNAAELMEQALELCRRTGGALDISVYPIDVYADQDRRNQQSRRGEDPASQYAGGDRGAKGGARGGRIGKRRRLPGSRGGGRLEFFGRERGLTRRSGMICTLNFGRATILPKQRRSI